MYELFLNGRVLSENGDIYIKISKIIRCLIEYTINPWTRAYLNLTVEKTSE